MHYEYSSSYPASLCIFVISFKVFDLSIYLSIWRKQKKTPNKIHSFQNKIHNTNSSYIHDRNSFHSLKNSRQTFYLTENIQAKKIMILSDSRVIDSMNFNQREFFELVYANLFINIDKLNIKNIYLEAKWDLRGSIAFTELL